MLSPLLEQLILALRYLPGVGPKSAQRMAFYLLERDKNQAKQLAQTILDSLEYIKYCSECRVFCENDLCKICSNPLRDKEIVCIVETAADLLAIEQAGDYSGVYFVLQGRLSPLDGMGPKSLGLELLQQRLDEGTIKEIIVATNATVEGEATAYYLAELVKKYNILISRIAYGVPLGGELEYLDGGTLVKALQQRGRI